MESKIAWMMKLINNLRPLEGLNWLKITVKKPILINRIERTIRAPVAVKRKLQDKEATLFKILSS